MQHELRVGLVADTHGLLRPAARAFLAGCDYIVHGGDVGANGEVSAASKYESLIISALKSGQQTSAILYLTRQREDSVSATAIPLKNDAGNVLAVLTVALSRTEMVQAQQHIRAISYGVATFGILLSIVISLWIAARVSRPVEQLARAFHSESFASRDIRPAAPVDFTEEACACIR